MSIFLVTSIFMLACTFIPSAVTASEAEDKFRIVFKTDRAFTIVKLESPPGSRNIVATTKEIKSEDGRRARMLSETSNAIDCGSPRGIRVLATIVNLAAGGAESEPDNFVTFKDSELPASFGLAKLEYTLLSEWISTVNAQIRARGLNPSSPNSTDVIVEYACRAAATHLNAAELDSLAAKLTLSAGFTDIQQLECDVMLDGISKPHRYNFFFTEAGRSFRIGYTWPVSGFVRDGELGMIGAGMQVSINRYSGTVNVMFTGFGSSTGKCNLISSKSKVF